MLKRTGLTEGFGATQFLEIFRGSNPIWHDRDDAGGSCPQWVFRGHSDADWRLRPLAWRKKTEGNPLWPLIERLMKVGACSSSRVLKRSSNEHNASAWVHAERVVLNEFRRLARRVGFDVEEYVSDWVLSTETTSFEAAEDLVNNPSIVAGRDVGLAQHYGIPTRMLDWTYNPIIAVFFAVDGNQGNKDLAVWALQTSYELDRLRLWSPPRINNPYLAAQDGVLVEVCPAYSLQFFHSNGLWPGLEDVIEENNRESQSTPDKRSIYDNHNHPCLRRIVLAKEHVPELRLMLEREGITRERLMPSLENVAKSTLRRVLW